MSEAWAIVETVGTEEEAALIAGFLESRGISAQVESLLFRQEPVTFGRMGEVRVRVPRADLDEARRLLSERRLRFGLLHREPDEERDEVEIEAERGETEEERA